MKIHYWKPWDFKIIPGDGKEFFKIIWVRRGCPVYFAHYSIVILHLSHNENDYDTGLCCISRKERKITFSAPIQLGFDFFSVGNLISFTK